MSPVKILGFYHVCLINHWQEIVREQLDCIMSSGLYEASEHIFIGAVGAEEQLGLLSDLLRQLPKIKIVSYSPNIEHYEFETLQMLKDKSDKREFYGWYIHTKGVSWDKENAKAYTGGTYWRKFMNYYTITKWEDNVANLKSGYDLSGTQIRTQRMSPAFKFHYSGNFFWFNSEYVKLLKPVQISNNRWDAEMYICSNFPIAATLNQEWVDYNTNKVWQNP